MILHFRDGNLENPTVWKKWTTNLNGRYEVEPKKLSRRSNMQNAYYWGVVVEMVWQRLKELGNEFTKQEVHEGLKAKFNYSEVVNQNTGEFIQIPLSTATLPKPEFSEYLAKIQRWGAEFLDIYIPDPNEQLEAF